MIVNLCEVVLLAIFVWFWYIGGQGNRWRRLMLCPAFLAAGIALKVAPDWYAAIGLALITYGTGQTFRLGYGAYGPEHDLKPSFLGLLTHDRGGWWIRAIWGVIVALAASLPLFLWHYIGIWHFLGYVAGVSAVCFTVVRFRLNVFPTDALISVAIFSLVWLIK